MSERMIRGELFGLNANREQDPYVDLALHVFDLAMLEAVSGNGKAEPARLWIESEASYILAASLFGESAAIFRNWVLAGCPDPEAASQPEMRAQIVKEIEMPLDYEKISQQRVQVVDCKECNVSPQLGYLNSMKVYLKCPKCKKRTANHYFVMEAADEWEDLNE